jgi:uncharacterized protein HemX
MNSDLPELPTVAEEDSATVDKEAHKLTGKQGKAWFTLFIAWMALFFTAIGIAAGYKNWLRISDKTKANKATIEVIQAKISDVPSNNQLNTMRDELLQQTEAMQQQTSTAVLKTQKFAEQSQRYAETINTQMAEITQIQAKAQYVAKPSTDKEWLLSETEFLIRMASRKLHLDQSSQAAIVALKAADENLVQLGSPHYLPVRQQLSKDIMALENYPVPPIAKISQQITALMIQLTPSTAKSSNLSQGEKIILGEKQKEENIAPENVFNTGNSLWAKLKDQAYTQFNSAVIIRKHNQPIQDDLDADSRQQLYRLLQLRLETLRLLALQKLDKEYHQQIQLISKTVTQYYPQQRADTLLKMIKEWDSYQLLPKKPNILSSLQRLESALLTETISSEKAKK